MSSLPSPYVESAATFSVSMGGSASVLLKSLAGTGPSPELVRGFQNELYIGPWTLRNLTWSTPCELSPGVTGETGEFVAEIDGPGITLPNYAETEGFPCAPFGSSAEWSGTYAYSETAGPFRLGSQRYPQVGHATDAPQYAEFLVQEWCWFGDHNTKRETSFGGFSATLWLQANGEWGEAPDSDFDPINLGIDPINFTFGAVVFTGAFLEQGEFTGLSFAGEAVDTSALDDGVLLGSGGGNVTAANYTTDPGSTVTVQAPVILDYDVDPPKETEGETTGALVDTINVGTVMAPYVARRVFQRLSWETPTYAGYERLSINGPWAGEQEPPWDPDDLILLIWGVPPRLDPGEAASYDAIEVEFEAELPLTDPIGFGVVEEDLPYTHAIEIGVPGTNTPAWREWVGLGPDGKDAAGFGMDLTSRTKRADGETLPWAWNGYSYLWIQITGPEAVTLTFTVRGVNLVVADTHASDSSRKDDFTATETAWVGTYQVRIDHPGVSGYSYFIDLRFPRTLSIGGVTQDLPEGLPVDTPRVDRLEITGWTVGTWQIDRISLHSQIGPVVGDFPGDASLKLDVGAPESEDFDVLGIEHNGSAPEADTADRDRTTEHVGADGHALLGFYRLVGAESGLPFHHQFSLTEFVENSNLEGWTFTLLTAPIAAALSDGTAEIEPVVQDLEPQTGLSITAGTPATLPGRVMCGQLRPVAGIPFAVYTRQPKGHGSLWALGRVGGRRAPAGLGAAVSTGQTATTDAHGVLRWHPVPANGTDLVGLGSYSLALRAHDRRRIPAVLRVRRPGVSNLHTRRREFLVAWSADGSLHTAQAETPLPPFDHTTEVGEGYSPCLAFDPVREQVHLVYERNGSVYRRLSDSDGVEWWEETLVMSGVLPCCRFAADGYELTGVFVETGTGVGELHGEGRASGEPDYSEEFVFRDFDSGDPLSVTDAGFSFSWAGDGIRWLLSAYKVGETDLTHWQSWSEGRYWKEIS